MKIYTITDNATETIEWKYDGESFALVFILKSSQGDAYRAMVLNYNEAIKLNNSIQDSILERRRK